MELINKTYQLADLPEIAKLLADQVLLFKVVTFEGNLGSGKTTLIKALCQLLGVNEMVSSPTFSLVNEYETSNLGNSKGIYHIDLYRLKSEEEAIGAGIEEYMFSGDLCLIEWPERAWGIIPDDILRVMLDSPDIDHRHIRVVSSKN